MGEAVEADLKPRDLENGFFIGNAARGMVAASLVK
jgi:4-amino-4-deoxychorismate lyase/para-aminobenzoate synthetase/4-amino-4-deoxychorismate lyase